MTGFPLLMYNNDYIIEEDREWNLILVLVDVNLTMIVTFDIVAF